MTDQLSSAMAWLHGQRKESMSIPVTYSRGGLSVEVMAMPGDTRIEQVTGEGTVMTPRRDWIIDASALDFGTGPTQPERSDTITQHVGVNKHVYQVLPIADGDVWRWSDRYGTAYRVHTKRLKE
jgi:hypothetical protein